MTIYFSPSTKGFFDTAFHGPRKLEVVDREALQSALATAQVLDKAAFDDAVAQAVAGADGNDSEIVAIEDFTANRIAAKASPPMKTVTNPMCAVPTDAIEISPERHAELLAAQAEGQVIKTGAHGLPIAAEREADPDAALASIRATRNVALKASDWTQLADAELTAAKKKAWAAHRKHLRDLPRLVAAAIAEGRDPAAIELPVPPG